MARGVISIRMNSQCNDDFFRTVGLHRSDKLGDTSGCLLAVCDGDESAKDEVVALNNRTG